MCDAKRKQLKGRLWVSRRVHGHELGVFVREGEVGERRGGARWKVSGWEVERTSL